MRYKKDILKDFREIRTKFRHHAKVCRNQQCCQDCKTILRNPFKVQDNFCWQAQKWVDRYADLYAEGAEWQKAKRKGDQA